jgi:hypothetical protein
MKTSFPLIFLPVFILGLSGCTGNGNKQTSDEVIFKEVDGILAVEAESFYKQDQDETRRWYLIDGMESPQVGRDDDPSHAATSSGGAYLEILPDTRVTHDDKLIRGENFSNEAGQMAILYYKVNINQPGRYYVWVRAHSNGGEDNGIHVGLNGEWPASGQRMQWCDGKRDWRWESKQRTEEVHCGEPWKIYLDVEEAGEQEILFSMREDGFEFDKFILARDTVFKPVNEGPAPVLVKK